MGPHPAVATVRLAVRRALTGLSSGELAGLPGCEPTGRPGGELVLAACSGGADSLALAAALAFEAARLGLRAGGVTVDHGLQPGSAAQARAVTQALTAMGLDPVLSVTAEVARRGSQPGSQSGSQPGSQSGPRSGPQPGPAATLAGPDAPAGPAAGSAYPGPEAAARAGRYAALDAAASQAGASAILLGHTRDDQAEGVLLGLARGSGSRSLAGMAPRSGRYLRPLLAVSRTQTRDACAALGLQPWDDPHNSDPAYARARVRHQVMPVLEAALGPGISAALARSARGLRADADLLDSMAKTEAKRMTGADATLELDAVAALPDAIRTRVLRLAAIAAGCPPGALTAAHIAGLDDLVTRWHGQRWTDLPGGIRGQRGCGKLAFTAMAGPGASPPSHRRGGMAEAGTGRHGEGMGGRD